MSILYPADREALRALYGRLNNGDTPASDLGSWSSTSPAYRRQWQVCQFRDRHAQRLCRGMAHGHNPGEFCCGYSLADNPDLAGSATWNGELLGLTPDAAVVAGDAAISVNLTSMEGRADFTSLETWATGNATRRSWYRYAVARR